MKRTLPFEIDIDAILAIPDQAEREKRLAEVAAIKQAVDKNKLWTYIPHEGEKQYKMEKGIPLLGTEQRGQAAYHEIDAFCGAAVAGNRFGKTTACVVDNLIQTLPPHFIPPWLLQYKRWNLEGDEPFFCRTVVVDLPNALAKVMLPKVRALVPPAALLGGSWKSAWNERLRLLSFADGSWWDFLTHDMDIDAFSGAALHRVCFDEEPPGERGKAQYEESITRLVDFDGEVRFTLTPLLGLNWVYYELTDNGEPRHDDEVFVVGGSMEENPHIPDKMRERLVKRWEKEPLKLAARMHGSFVHFAGLVYDEFREARPPDGHVLNVPETESRLLIPRRNEESKPQVPIYASIDPGLDHPAALVFFWIDEHDVAEVFFAEKWQGYIIEDLATEYHTVCREFDIKPRWVTIDPSARNRNPHTGRNTQQELLRFGIATIPGQNAVMTGLDQVKERLRSQRLLIHDTCPQLIDEFRTYRWKQPKSQSDDRPKEAVIKTNDDLLDALRYGLMSMPAKAAGERQEEYESPQRKLFRESMERIPRKKRTRRYIGRDITAVGGR